MFLQWPPAQERAEKGAARTHTRSQLRCVYTLGEGLAEKAARLCVCEFSLAERKMRIFSPHLQT